MKVTIVTPQELLFEGDAKEVVLPGHDGEFSVLDFHQACVYALRQGQIKMLNGPRRAPGSRFFIQGGVALVELGKLKVIVEQY
jgi:F-type H+-transporting ATPase subunit epsilon